MPAKKSYGSTITKMYEQQSHDLKTPNATKITASDLVCMLQDAFIAGLESPSELMGQEVTRIMIEHLTPKKKDQPQESGKKKKPYAEPARLYGFLDSVHD